MKADQRARNRYLGGHKPFGYRVGDDGELVPDEAEQAEIKRAIAMRKRGKSFAAISAALTKRGHVITRQGLQKVMAAAEAGGQ